MSDTAGEFVFRRRVEFVETDMIGIVHFSNYFRFMEAAEDAFLRATGMAVHDPDEIPRAEQAGKARAAEGTSELPETIVVSWPRVSAHCDYIGPLYFPETLDIRVTVRKIGTKSVTYGFYMSVGPRPVARGEFVAVCCRMLGVGKMESIEIPAAMRERLASRLEASG